MDLLSHLPVFPQACPIRLYRHLACPRLWVWANPHQLAQEAHGVTHVRRAILTPSTEFLFGGARTPRAVHGRPVSTGRLLPIEVDHVLAFHEAQVTSECVVFDVNTTGIPCGGVQTTSGVWGRPATRKRIPSATMQEFRGSEVR